MKINIYILFFLFLICFFSCNEDTKDYQLLFTGEVTHIDDTGALISAKYINQTTTEITEYGFEWGKNRVFSTKIRFKKSLEQDTFSYKIEGNLDLNAIYYVRSYVVINDSNYYSNIVSFKSLGSRTVEFYDFEPKSAFAGDTITIYGRYFALYNSGNIVSLNNQNIETIISDTNFIRILVPYNIVSTKDKLTVTVSDKEVQSDDSLTIKDTWVKTTENIIINSNASYLTYGITGFYANNNLYLRCSIGSGFYAYNLNTGLINRMKDYPFYWWNFIMFTINNNGYILFLPYGDKSLAEYDSEKNSWTDKSRLPIDTTYYSFSMNAVIGDNAYIGLADNGIEFSNALWKYDSKNDNWTKMSDFPDKPLEKTTSFAYDGKAYVGFGNYFWVGSSNSNLWEYDPKTDKWKIYTTFPGNLGYNLIAIIYRNKLFIGKNDFWEYNFQTKKWKQIGNFIGNTYGNGYNFPFIANDSLYIASLIPENTGFTSFSLIKLNKNE